MSKPEPVIAIVVTYNSYTAIEVPLLRVADEVTAVVVVDNGSNPSVVERIRRAVAPIANVELICLAQNVGLGAALNLGIRAARRNSTPYVLLLDDDSELQPGAIRCLRESLELGGNADVALSAATWITEVGGDLSALDMRPFTVDEVPISGSLIRSSVFESLGFFREDYFLDYVDFEFGRRAQSRGWRLLSCPAARCLQRPGRPETAKVFGRTTIISNYPPERLYLMVRNGLALYMWEQRSWRLLKRHLQMVVVRLVKILLFEGNKPSKVVATWLGVVDGLCRRLGPPRRHFNGRIEMPR